MYLLSNFEIKLLREMFCCLVMKSCLILCGPVDCSMPGFSVLHCLPGVCSNSCPLYRWCHSTISSSVSPLSSCFQPFPASGSFPMIWIFASGGRSIGASALASVFSMKIQGWFPFGVTGVISLQPKGLLQSSAPQFKNISSSILGLLYGPILTSIHSYWKNHGFDRLLSAKWCLCSLRCCLGLL